MLRLFGTLILLSFALLASGQKKQPAQWTRSNPGAAINTQWQEYAPVISADGNTLLFTSRRAELAGQKGKDKLGLETVYISNFDTATGKWLPAVALGGQINQPGRHNSAIALSNDGQKMLLYRDDDSGNGDVYESMLSGSSWSVPKSLGKPVCSKHHESSASIAPDGRTIYFVSDRPGGTGKRDIWYCTANNEGQYQEAKHAGPTLNSPYEEEGVFIHPDGRTIYFSSDRPGGFGGFDLYKSVFKKNAWSAPENLGPEINTTADEIYFVSEASGKRNFISSAGSGSIGLQDIIIVYATPESDTDKVQGPSLCLLKGVVSDAVSHLPLEASLEIIDNSTGVTLSKIKSNSESGKYLVSLPAGKDYGIRVTASGYLFYSENIKIAEASGYSEQNHNIDLNKLEAGKRVILKNIFYAFNSTELTGESMSELDHLIKLLNENPTIRVEISGHTDDAGSDEYNLKLSAGRAESVVKYLTSKGISSNRLQAKGYGETQPIVPNDTPERQAMNRRTEFTILSK